MRSANASFTLVGCAAVERSRAAQQRSRRSAPPQRALPHLGDHVERGPARARAHDRVHRAARGVGAVPPDRARDGRVLHRPARRDLERARPAPAGVSARPRGGDHRADDLAVGQLPRVGPGLVGARAQLGGEGDRVGLQDAAAGVLADRPERRERVLAEPRRPARLLLRRGLPRRLRRPARLQALRVEDADGRARGARREAAAARVPAVGAQAAGREEARELRAVHRLELEGRPAAARARPADDAVQAERQRDADAVLGALARLLLRADARRVRLHRHRLVVRRDVRLQHEHPRLPRLRPRLVRRRPRASDLRDRQPRRRRARDRLLRLRRRPPQDAGGAGPELGDARRDGTLGQDRRPLNLRRRYRGAQFGRAILGARL